MKIHCSPSHEILLSLVVQIQMKITPYSFLYINIYTHTHVEVFSVVNVVQIKLREQKHTTLLTSLCQFVQVTNIGIRV